MLFKNIIGREDKGWPRVSVIIVFVMLTGCTSRNEPTPSVSVSSASVSSVIMSGSATGTDQGVTASIDIPSDDSDAIVHSIEAWNAALADGDGSRTCELMTAKSAENLRLSLESPDCRSAVARLYGVMPPEDKEGLRSVKVNREEVRIDGDRAVVPSAAITYGKPLNDQLRLNNELALERTGNEWTLAVVIQR